MQLTLTVLKHTSLLHQLAFDTMAAFNFPDPTIQQTVTNPITGSTYQWKEPPGKWVITTKVRAVSDIIYEGDTPPTPRGEYKLWYSTDTLELYFWYEDVNGNGAWVPTAAPITMLEDLDEGLFEVRQLLNQVNSAAITNENDIILIRESLGKVNLQEVLDNGNTADKDIYLTHIASSDSDIIDVSPEKAKVIIATEGSKVPTFELQHYAVDDNSQVKLELDEDGTRFDVECDEKVNNIHFRFEDDVKLEINKNGDAVFQGGVEVKGSLKSNGLTNQGNATFKFGSGQGVIIDSGSTFEPMLELKSYSGPGQRKEVFSVNARGAANLLGKLTLAPGEVDNEAVTYGQLATVAEQIEQVIPAYERGKYNFSLTDVSTGSSDRGKYTLLRLNTASDNAAATKACEDARNTCNRIPDKDPIDCEIEFNSCIARLPTPGTIDIVTNSFNSVQKIKFSKYDADGAKHEWTDVGVGQLIDIFNDGDDNYFVGEITAIDNSNANLVLLTVNKVQAKGNAVGAARIKVFTLNNEIDELTNYVRKTGDTITGSLAIDKNLTVNNRTDFKEKVRISLDPEDGGSSSFIIYGKVNGQDEQQLLRSTFHERTSSENDKIEYYGLSDTEESLVNKKYVDSRRLWKWTGDQSSSPGEGMFSFSSSGAGYLYFHPWPKVGTKLRCDGNKYFGKGGEIEDEKWYGYAQFSLWSWDGTYWSPAMSGHVSSSGVRTGKDKEPWRFSSNKNSILTLEGLSLDKLYNICISGTILA